MPTYTYRNLDTGQEWTEIRPIADRLDGVDDIKICLVPGAPRLADPSLSTKRAQEFQDKVIAPKKQFYPGLK